MTNLLRFRSAVLVLWTILAVGAWQAAAQTEEGIWSTPFNLSASGAAKAPVLVTDSFGGYHVIWQDEHAGYVYASYFNEAWSEPVVVQLPFSDDPFSSPGSDTFDQFSTPVLVADSNYVMHGLWIDDDDILWYSHAVVSEIHLGANSWIAPIQIASEVKAVDVVAGAYGRLYISYIYAGNTAELPAGVYAQYSDDGGFTWSTPSLVYQSDYLRSVNSENTHMDMAATPDQFTGVITTTNESGETTSSETVLDGDRVHVAWDDPEQDTVLTARSLDGGITWETAAIDFRGAEDPAEGPGPGRIRLFVLGDEVHLTWHASHEEDKCSQYHQLSSDKGQTWQPRQVTYTDSECATDGQFVYSLTNVLFLLTNVRTEAYLQAWDGSQWTAAQPQGPAGSFTDPHTFRPVILGCQQTAVTPANEVLVIGCGKSNGDDIWAAKRPLRELADWSPLFAPTPMWSQPQPVAASPVHILPPTIVAGTDGRLHAFWSQTAAPVASGRIEDVIAEVGSAIYYSRLDAGSWSPPRPVLTSPEGKADQPTVVSNEGRLFVAWSGGTSGGIYFSRALADRAASVTEWNEPLLLPAPGDTGTAPRMVMDRAGMLYVIYTIPLNENRGIYLTKSADNGNTWSEPIRVFDGVAANWEMVGPARLTLTGVNDLHLLWTRQTLPTGTGTLELVYGRSEDGGETWTEPRPVVQEAVFATDIVGIGELTLHRVWLSLNENRPLLWHQSSLDNGNTWNNPTRVSDPNTTGGTTSLIVDAAGEPHLFQLAQSNSGQLLLQEWLWNGTNWEAGENADLGGLATNADALAAIAAPDNTLGVIYASLLLDEASGLLQDNLFYAYRAWQVPEVFPTPPPTLTPTPPPAPTETPTPQPSPTPTVSLATVAAQGVSPGALRADNPMGGIVFGLAPAALLVLLVFIIALRVIRAK